MAEPRKNVRMTVAYDGRDFYGWQRLKDHPTVQGTLEAALTAACGVRVEVRGAGRTDRGAHARGQVATARIPQSDDLTALADGLQARLPASIEVRDLCEVPKDFHPRYGATGKRYVYVIHNAPELPEDARGRVWHVPEALDVEAMRAALPVLIGTHDFASFATKVNYDRESSERTVTTFTLEHAQPRITFTIEADGFLYKMVRNLVRAVVKVGEGRLDAQGLQAVLTARDRHAAPGTAPASGLTLDAVFFEEPTP
ncbi:MAG: tRNA pseudouridine(38-40) synthase TruA [Myxococcota bacterium]